VKTAGENAIDSGEQFRAGAQIRFRRRGVLHCRFGLRVGTPS
jgi:hypothetical protein